MEGNPCYEATAVKQTADMHLYEAVRGGGGKRRKTDKNVRHVQVHLYSIHGVLNVGIVR